MFLGIHHTMAARILKLFVIDEVLEEVSKGSFNALASRYRINKNLPDRFSSKHGCNLA